jgi:hypothetical protein
MMSDAQARAVLTGTGPVVEWAVRNGYALAIDDGIAPLATASGDVLRRFG